MGNGGSPTVRTEWTIDGANIAIEYGRPSLKGRTPGKELPPYEASEWRTGADEQTALITDKPLRFGTLTVPPGRHGLYTISIQGTWLTAVHGQPFCAVTSRSCCPPAAPTVMPGRLSP